MTRRLLLAIWVASTAAAHCSCLHLATPHGGLPRAWPRHPQSFGTDERQAHIIQLTKVAADAVRGLAAGYMLCVQFGNHVRGQCEAVRVDEGVQPGESAETASSLYPLCVDY